MTLFALFACSSDPCARPIRDLWCDLTVAGGALHCRYAQTASTDLMLGKARERVEIYRIRYGSWPADWAAAGLRPAPVDAWGNPIRLVQVQDGVRLVSDGADGVPGGACEAEDRMVAVVRRP